MKTVRVYDWPVRLFHASFAGLFLGALIIVKTVDDESPAFAYHMLLGLVLAASVVLRVIWGFVGSRYARFSSFALRPSELLGYFRNVLLGRAERRLGHNPASSWAALIMMALAIGLAVTGILMATGGEKELTEEVHEILANAFLVTAAAHVAGVVLHMLRHRDRIALSMVHGGKKPVDGEAGIPRAYAGAGVAFLVILGTFALHLGRHYDASTGNLDVFGSTLSLVEAEHGQDHGERFDEERQDD